MSTLNSGTLFECADTVIEDAGMRLRVDMPSMETNEEKAIRYRYRAEEVRALAVLGGPDDKIRDALLAIAERYEEMAADLEPERMFG